MVEIDGMFFESLSEIIKEEKERAIKERAFAVSDIILNAACVSMKQAVDGNPLAYLTMEIAKHQAMAVMSQPLPPNGSIIWVI